jgi:hypothetical protein
MKEESIEPSELKPGDIIRWSDGIGFSYKRTAIIMIIACTGEYMYGKSDEDEIKKYVVMLIEAEAGLENGKIEKEFGIGNKCVLTKLA